MMIRKDASAAAILSPSDITNDEKKKDLSSNTTPSTTALEIENAHNTPKPTFTDVKVPSSHSSNDAVAVGSDVIEADDEDPGPGAFAHLDIKAIHRKMDFRIVPMLTVLYLLSFLDRGNIGESSLLFLPVIAHHHRLPARNIVPSVRRAGIDADLLGRRGNEFHIAVSFSFRVCVLTRIVAGNANIEGLSTDLRLTGAQYNWCLTAFFFTYAAFEVPSNMVLKRLKPSIWLPSEFARIFPRLSLFFFLLRACHCLLGENPSPMFEASRTDTALSRFSYHGRLGDRHDVDGSGTIV
jgi:hypothetical protein